MLKLFKHYVQTVEISGALQCIRNWHYIYVVEWGVTFLRTLYILML